jgi:hypothetical protein
VGYCGRVCHSCRVTGRTWHVLYSMAVCVLARSRCESSHEYEYFSHTSCTLWPGQSGKCVGISKARLAGRSQKPLHQRYRTTRYDTRPAPALSAVSCRNTEKMFRQIKAQSHQLLFSGTVSQSATHAPSRRYCKKQNMEGCVRTRHTLY